MPINPATTNLAGKNLSDRPNKADFRGVSLAQHRLMDANLSGLDLTGTSFEEADCTGANFTGAILDRADFRGAVVTLEQIKAAKSVEGVLLPEKLLPQPPPPDPDAALLAEIERLKAENERLKQQPSPPEPVKARKP